MRTAPVADAEISGAAVGWGLPASEKGGAAGAGTRRSSRRGGAYLRAGSPGGGRRAAGSGGEPPLGRAAVSGRMRKVLATRLWTGAMELPAGSGDVTRLLRAAASGEPAAVGALWSAVYEELRRLARQQLAREGPGCSLDSTALVHEAYLRMVGPGPVVWENRRHFFGAAARAMRQIRVDDARRRGRARGGREPEPGPAGGQAPSFDDDPLEVLAVDEALRALERVAPRRAEVVLLRYFGGLSVDETAAVLDVAPRTVDEEWRFARAWLHRELSKGGSTRILRAEGHDAGDDRAGL